MQAALQQVPGLSVMQGEVADLLVAKDEVQGVHMADGATLLAKKVVLTTGTFLGGVIHIGDIRYSAGRFGDAAAHALSRTLARTGFALGRLKTGTPPRLDGRTIRYSILEEQLGDDPPRPFSFLNHTVPHAKSQIRCHVTYTNPATHEIIRASLHRTPNFDSGEDGKGLGPRCASSRSAPLREP